MAVVRPVVSALLFKQTSGLSTKGTKSTNRTRNKNNFLKNREYHHFYGSFRIFLMRLKKYKCQYFLPVATRLYFFVPFVFFVDMIFPMMSTLNNSHNAIPVGSA